jgi:hypothetical protein
LFLNIRFLEKYYRKTKYMHFHIEKQRYRSCNNIADKTRGGLHNPLSLSLSLSRHEEKNKNKKLPSFFTLVNCLCTPIQKRRW